MDEATEATERSRTWAVRVRGRNGRSGGAESAPLGSARFRRGHEVSGGTATLDPPQIRSDEPDGPSGLKRFAGDLGFSGRSGGTLTLPLPSRSRFTTRPRLQHLLEGRGWVSLQLLTDVVAASLAVVLAVLSMGGGEVAAAGPWLLGFPLVLAGMLQLRGLYRRKVRVAILDGVGPIAGAISVACMVLLVPATFLFGNTAAGSGIARTWAFGLLLVMAGRASLVLLQRRARTTYLVGKPTLVVGAGVVGAQIARRLEEKPEYGLRPVGFLDADPLSHEGDGTSNDFDAPNISVMGSPEDLAHVAAATGAEHVIFAFTGAPDHELVSIARRCEALGLEVSLVPRFFESLNDRFQLERVGSLPLFGLRAVDPKGWQFGVKYALDRVLAGLAIVVLSHVLIVVAIAVKLTSPGPVLFKQRRVGRDGHAFDLYKFRSMRVEVPADRFKVRAGMAPGGIEGDDRRTPLGRFLRRSALDELPQLFNVLKGDMSIVGPRPERPEFVDLFGRDLARYTDRHRVKCGITGWAQVCGLRGQTSIQDRIEWDNVYIENWSLWFDVKIMLLTLGAVARTGYDA
jgi:exopolysaccharide biosynthesis polyprenyl glycosylphosphotransferase